MNVNYYIGSIFLNTSLPGLGKEIVVRILYSLNYKSAYHQCDCMFSLLLPALIICTLYQTLTYVYTCKTVTIKILFLSPLKLWVLLWCLPPSPPWQTTFYHQNAFSHSRLSQVFWNLHKWSQHYSHFFPGICILRINHVIMYCFMTYSLVVHHGYKTICIFIHLLMAICCCFLIFGYYIPKIKLV